jgi:hypothetical protein
MQFVLNAARILLVVDVPAAVQAAHHALDIGCFIDPTLWRQNQRKLREDLEVLEAALPLYRLATKIAERDDVVP